MKRVIRARLWRLCGITAAVALPLGSMIALTSATPAAAAATYYPSVSVNHEDGVKVGETLEVTGKDFPPNTKITLYQCNQGMIDAPNGVFTSKTCDLKNTPTTESSSTGTIATHFKVEVGTIDDEPGALIGGHGRFFWGWIHISIGIGAYLTDRPTETWLKKQTVELSGLDIPAPAAGTTDVAAECNDNVLSGDTSACGTPTTVTVNSKGKAKGKLSVIMGTVGDGTCGTGPADEVCYIVLANATSGGTPTEIAIDPIDFYES